MVDLDPELMAAIQTELDEGQHVNGTQPDPEDTWAGWKPQDLGPALRGEVVLPPPTMLKRTDGVPLIYPAKTHSIAAEPGAGKSTLIGELCRREIEAGNRVLIVDFETGPVEIGAKLRDLGTDPDRGARQTIYLNPEGPLTDPVWERLKRDLDGVTVGWIDGVTEAMEIHNLEVGSNNDVASWQRLLPKRLKRLGIASVEIDHLPKDTTRKTTALGGQHKKAGTDVTYYLECAETFGRGKSGSSRLLVGKDRFGHVTRYEIEPKRQVGVVRYEAGNDGSLTVTIEPPDEKTGPFRPTYLMEQVSRAVEAHPAATKNTIRQLVNGKHDAKDLALTLLVDEGFVRVERDGQAHRHTSVRPFREDPDA